MTRENHARDHGIAKVNGPAFLFSGCHQVACLLSGVEGSNSFANLVENGLTNAEGRAELE